MFNLRGGRPAATVSVLVSKWPLLSRPFKLSCNICILYFGCYVRIAPRFWCFVWIAWVLGPVWFISASLSQLQRWVRCWLACWIFLRSYWLVSRDYPMICCSLFLFYRLGWIVMPPALALALAIVALVLRWDLAFDCSTVFSSCVYWSVWFWEWNESIPNSIDWSLSFLCSSSASFPSAILLAFECSLWNAQYLAGFLGWFSGPIETQSVFAFEVGVNDHHIFYTSVSSSCNCFSGGLDLRISCSMQMLSLSAISFQELSICSSVFFPTLWSNRSPIPSSFPCRSWCDGLSWSSNCRRGALLLCLCRSFQ